MLEFLKEFSRVLAIIVFMVVIGVSLHLMFATAGFIAQIGG